MTSNGFLFPKKGKTLRDAGLRRVTFSCDSLDRANFQKMTGRYGLHEVLESIRLAQDLGLNPVKGNAVLINHEIEAPAKFQFQHWALSLMDAHPLKDRHFQQRSLGSGLLPCRPRYCGVISRP